MTSVQTCLSQPSSQETHADKATETLTVSFVVVFSGDDEEAEEVLQRYIHTLQEVAYQHELIVINNGQGDVLNEKIFPILKAAATHAKILQIHVTAAESQAFSHGFKECSGDVIVVLPSYLQVDPQDILPLTEQVTSGKLDLATSWRSERVDSTWDSWKSRAFNWLARRVTGSELHDVGSPLRAMKRDVAEELPIYGDLYRFLPILADRHGFRVGEVKVRHLEERVRKGDYRLGVYVRRLLDMLTLFFLIKFTRKPLRFFGLLGSTVLFVGLATIVLLVTQRFLGQSLGNRPLFVLSVMMIVLGAQLFSIGLLGELVIFTHARDLKEYHVEKVFEDCQE